MSATTRRCGKPKKNGEPCKAWKLKGRDCCLAHADEATQAEVAFGGAQPGAGRPRKAKPAEIEKRLLESHSIAWMRPYWRVLGFDVKFDEDGELALIELPEGGAKLYGESRDGVVRVSEYEDLGAQMAAAEKLRDRVFGRPTARSEFSGTVAGKSALEIDSTIEREIEKLRVKFMTDAGLPLPEPDSSQAPPPEPKPPPELQADDTDVDEDAEPAEEPSSAPAPDPPAPEQSGPREPQRKQSWLRRAEIEA